MKHTRYPPKHLPGDPLQGTAFFRRHLPPSRLLALLLALATDLLVYIGTRLLNTGRPHHDMACALDARIPLWPPAVGIYLMAFAFWAVGYLLIAGLEREAVCRFFAADGLARVVCLACFLVWPSCTVRPVVPDGGFWAWLTQFVYLVDEPNNLFPSLHCLISWLCWAGVRGRREVSVIYRRFAFIMAVLICLSTLLTKQHVVWDLAAGILLAEICWQLAQVKPVCGLYSRGLAWAERRFDRP